MQELFLFKSMQFDKVYMVASIDDGYNAIPFLIITEHMTLIHRDLTLSGLHIIMSRLDNVNKSYEGSYTIRCCNNQMPVELNLKDYQFNTQYASYESTEFEWDYVRFKDSDDIVKF